jgi:hypothetical protein
VSYSALCAPIRVHHLNQHLRFANRRGEGIPPLHPAREAPRPPSLARRRDCKGWSPSPLSRLGPLQTECHNGGMVSITSFLQKDKRSRRTGGMDLIRIKEPCATQAPLTAITRCLRHCLHFHPHAGPPLYRNPTGRAPRACRATVRPAPWVRPRLNHSTLYPIHPNDASPFYQFTAYS